MDAATLANYAQIASFIISVVLLVWPMLKEKWPDKPRIVAYAFLMIWVLTTTYLYFDEPKVTVIRAQQNLHYYFLGAPNFLNRRNSTTFITGMR